jgi:hypothetical protein
MLPLAIGIAVPEHTLFEHLEIAASLLAAVGAAAGRRHYFSTC